MIIQVRDYDILLWLVYYPFSKLEQMKHLFDCANPNRAPYRRLLKLQKEGLIEKVRIYTEPRQLYLATRKAVVLLRKIGFQYVPGVVKDKKCRNFDHDTRLIDIHLLFVQELKIGIWVPERVIRSIRPKGNSPDALLMTADANYAIEYERTTKEPQRYKKIFGRYRGKENYDAVLYILPSEARIDRLREKLTDIPKNIFFISETALFREREKATFFSVSDGLPVKDLIYWSRGGSVEDLELEELKEVVQSESSDGWKDRKPLPAKTRTSYFDDAPKDYEASDHSFDPAMNPPMYPDESRYDEDPSDENALRGEG